MSDISPPRDHPLSPPEPLADGRQSETALMIRRGVGRLMRSCGYALIAELGLASGHRADLVALGPKSELAIVEIKSSLEDLRADRKWPHYHAHCDRFYFATRPGVPLDAFPEGAGLILADGFGAEILREAPEHRLAGATRRAMLLRFAHAAAKRLHDLEDPGLRLRR